MLSLNDQQIKELDRMLGEIPYKFAAPIVVYLQQRFAEQQAQKPPEGDSDGLS